MAAVRRRKKPQGFKRLLALGDGKLKEIERLLLLGTSALLIAEKVQTDWGDYKDVKVDTLAKQIQRYRESHVDPHFAVAANKIDPEKGQILLSRVEGQIDVIEELTELCVVQKARIKKIIDKEEKMPLLFNWMNGELRTMQGLLVSLGTMQMETGVLRRVPKTAAILMAQTDGSQTKHAMVLRESEKVNKAMAEATRRAMEELGLITPDDVIEGTVDDDGASPFADDT